MSHGNGGSELRVYNTLTRTKEVFVPISGCRVNLFVCGPTVYDFPHLGHGKTYTQFDFIVRFLRMKGFNVVYLQNITDIDDKIIRRAKERGIPWKDLALQFEEIYRADMAALGNTSVSTYARATDYLPQIVSQVQTLVRRGFAYHTSSGINFEVAKFAEYGKLSRRQSIQASDSQSRIDEDPEKRGWNDFCLWKASKDGEPSWDTELGHGRPGWHIEDTAITEELFGPQYDVHGGAVDLQFPHHEAEIAQMEAASGRAPLVKYWLHTGFLNQGSDKMSKSRGDSQSIRSALEKYDYRVLRFAFLSHHYRQGISYSEALLDQSKGALRRIDEFAAKIEPTYDDTRDSEAVAAARGAILSALDDDFDTPTTFRVLFDFMRDQNAKGRSGLRTLALMQELNSVFDIVTISPRESDTADSEVEALVRQRNEHRRRREWKKADDVRDLLLSKGVQISDAKDGVRWRRVSSARELAGSE